MLPGWYDFFRPPPGFLNIFAHALVLEPSPELEEDLLQLDILGAGSWCGGLAMCPYQPQAPTQRFVHSIIQPQGSPNRDTLDIE